MVLAYQHPVAPGFTLEAVTQNTCPSPLAFSSVAPGSVVQGPFRTRRLSQHSVCDEPSRVQSELLCAVALVVPVLFVETFLQVFQLLALAGLPSATGCLTVVFQEGPRHGDRAVPITMPVPAAANLLVGALNSSVETNVRAATGQAETTEATVDPATGVARTPVHQAATGLAAQATAPPAPTLSSRNLHHGPTTLTRNGEEKRRSWRLRKRLWTLIRRRTTTRAL